jgi:4-diphosphocytidyl-2-C-methyl-D-erythritol kinase
VSGPLVVAAPAKVNLFLHVGDKRADGYHDLQSLVAFTAFGDEISLFHDDVFSLSLSGPFADQLSGGEDNLALQAGKLLAKKIGTGRGARIKLRKNLPVASGLGGGSADAAAVLRGLMGLWRLDANRKSLLETAELLGADVPACVVGGTSWMEGKGERVHPLPPLPKTGVLLVNPGVQIATTSVFAALRSHRGLAMQPPQSPFPDARALVRFLRGTTNDLELPAQTIAPVVADVLQELNALPDALFARMSGSGATCFALFVDDEGSSTAASMLRNRHPSWWITETTFFDTASDLCTS